MFATFKSRLQEIRLYPMARQVYRSIDPDHRRERRLRHRFFTELVRPGDLCFDIGANVGQTTEALLACGASVVAVEPNPSCHPTLRYQFSGNRRVTLIGKAVGSSPGMAALHFQGAEATASLREDWNRRNLQTVMTEVITLDQLMATYGVPRLLKVDVEGYEIEVFRGLDRVVPIIYFEMLAREAAAVPRVLERLAELGTIEGVSAVSEDHGHWLLDRFVPASRFLRTLPASVTKCNVVVRMHDEAQSG